MNEVKDPDQKSDVIASTKQYDHRINRSSDCGKRTKGYRSWA